jgi:hypothetical protein
MMRMALTVQITVTLKWRRQATQPVSNTTQIL